ncbi:hypothetical protein [Rhizobium halophytocola]|uniref:Amino acid permease n=1 Tax=Rhizobium halophytocola TaxID=735519 RepID=A0ABS4E5S9_9HYPH|nr:hypothetical protein [Rhizobium halophytocola]MBP1853266.1 hypothetical protein [Rhizobium halophytocola]
MDETREKLIWNERRKLRATWLNQLSSASIVVGVATPTVAYSIGIIKTFPMIGAIVWTLAFRGLHFAALREVCALNA